MSSLPVGHSRTLTYASGCSPRETVVESQWYKWMQRDVADCVLVGDGVTEVDFDVESVREGYDVASFHHGA